MANETIELVHSKYEPKKLRFPVLFQEKLDGVPVKFENVGGRITARTRQNEIVTSCDSIGDTLSLILLSEGDVVVGEIYERGVAFKTISGRVRSTKEDIPLSYALCVFDGHIAPMSADDNYIDRYKTIWRAVMTVDVDTDIKMIPAKLCHDALEVDEALAALMAGQPKAEGAVVHSIGQSFQPGKRPASTQKLKPKPTLDIRVLRFEEAVSGKDGSGLGMVGRVVCELLEPGGKRSEIGVGPGKLTHKERTELWLANQDSFFATVRIAQVEYMLDATYDALRQPTFQCWRPDKLEPEIYVR